MTFYPIDPILPSLKEAVLNNSSVILHAPPGAGKTTRVPLALLDLVPQAKGRIIMLEPRRIAAVSAARWMAKCLNEEVGQTVGYAIRFDTKRSEKTRIEVVTEGILARRIQSDPGLEQAAIVIFDEFHERTIHADLALALCLDIRKQLRDDLRIIVMSATLDPRPLVSLLGAPPVIRSEGGAFPVEERYLPDAAADLPRGIARAVRTALRESEGDILVFLPGSREIRACDREIRTSFNLDEERIALHALYGDLPFDAQEQAIMPSKERRKIILATNIAETSLTIEGVRAVVDSGLTRLLRYDPSTGMNRLVTALVSKASAEQRKGRAGRLGPGVCYRLYGKDLFHGMQSFTQPEIIASDLSQLVLELAVWGVGDPESLSWLDTPPRSAWDAGQDLLGHLGALGIDGRVTSTGRAMARLPLHPRLSRLLLKAKELGCTDLGADLAAILQERDILRRDRTNNASARRDISERVELLRNWRVGKEEKTLADVAALKNVDRTAKQLLRLVQETGDKRPEQRVNDKIISRLVLSAFPDRICKRREEAGRFVILSGRGVSLSTDSPLAISAYVVAVSVDAGEKAEGFIHIAAPLTEELIRSECKNRIETAIKIAWDEKESRIIGALEERLGKLVIAQKIFTPSDDESAPVLCEVIRTNARMITFTREARQFQARATLMKKSFPEELWPDLSDDGLLARLEEWLLPWLAGIRTGQGLKGLNILPALRANLSWEQGRLLEERTPSSIIVPSGNRVKVEYTEGDLPVLAVKLQEMFGLADTPTVGEGRVKVLLHLLSPAGRPVQVTHDLKSFWNTGYPLVKKELKGRYPKHPWPDDPWNAVPTRRTKKREK